MMNALPHPSLLPTEKERRAPQLGNIQRQDRSSDYRIIENVPGHILSPGERAGVRVGQIINEVLRI